MAQDSSDGPLVLPVVHQDSSNPACGSHFCIHIIFRLVLPRC